MCPGMAQSPSAIETFQHDPHPFDDVSADAENRVRIEPECLEVSASTPEELNVLRAWVRRINSTTYAQPYFVEGPPGHFRLYVGEAAERVRTAQGIQ